MPKYLQIAVNVPINQTFTYLDCDNPENSSRIGRRADIKFGNHHTSGYIIAESDIFPADCAVEQSKIRPINKILDETQLFGDELIETAYWLSSFYLCSIGEALSAMLPLSTRDKTNGGFSLSEDTFEQEKKLSEEQSLAVNNILNNSSKPLHYLYGPTGSGKTEVFLQITKKLLQQNKGVIYLVPEISLTSQVIQSFTDRFGSNIAVLHSRLTPNKKLSEWKRILNKEARIVIGVRSAVFAPVPDLGLIIIDEEHDGSYKSGNTPRYHARQVAMHRCAKLKIPLLMGSATPSVEAWHMMNTGIIQKHCLTKRLAGGAMPKIMSINLSEQNMDSSCISSQLKDEIDETLKQNRQTILFLNRRGFTHFYRCNTCGYELKCKNCSVSMTYHKNEKRLRCHYCGWNATPPQQCPECGSLDVGYSGFGTEYIESEVQTKFPNAKVVRIDTDSVSHKGELEAKIEAFRNGEYDIMLGTQMVAKGLNFPNLKLVGVILADTGLHLPDFRASERTFSIITQVAGRCGRYFPDGKVIVQTYNPEREPIFYAVNGRTEDFYNTELETRKLLGFPPYSRFLRLVFRAPTENQARISSYNAAQILQSLTPKDCNIEIMGPAPCPLEKIAANYRYQILLKGSNIYVLQKIAGAFLFNYTKPTDIYIESDVDPVSLL